MERFLIYKNRDIPNFSENFKDKAEKKIQHDQFIDQRMDVNPDEELLNSDEIEAQNAVEHIAGVRKSIEEKQKAYYEAFRDLYFKTIRDKSDEKTSAECNEKVALAFRDLVNSYADIIKIQEEAKDPDFVRKLAGNLLKVDVPMLIYEKATKTTDIPVLDLMQLSDLSNTQGVAKRKETHTSSRVKTITKTYKIPQNTEEYNILANGAEMALLGARANLFLISGDEKYEQYYLQDVEQRNKNLVTNGKTALKRAKKADNGNLSDVQSILRVQDNDEKYKELESYSDLLAQKQLEIEKMRATDPVKAYGMANEFFDLINNLENDIHNNTVTKKIAFGNSLQIDTLGTRKNFFKDLKGTSPKVFERFSQIVSLYKTKTTNLVRDIVQKDQEILNFQRELDRFIKSGEGLFKTFDNLNKEIAKGETPSDYYMEKIHEELDAYINSPYFQKIQEIWPRKKYLAYMEHGLDKVPEAKNIFTQWEKGYEALAQYRKQILLISEEIKDIGGDNIGLTGFLKDAAKFMLVIAACVGTGMGAAAIGMGTFATLSSISAVSTLGNASLDYLDGNGNAFDPNALMEGYMTSLAVSWASGVLARPIGQLWGSFAKNLNNKFATSNVEWLKKFAERGYAEKLFDGANETFKRKLVAELFEESLEDGMKRLGEAVAPKYPLIGAVFQILGTSASVARARFHNGPFKISNQIRGNVTDQGVRLEYTDPVKIREFLAARGIDPASLTILEQTGELNLEQNGLRLVVNRIYPSEMAPQAVQDNPTILESLRRNSSRRLLTGMAAATLGLAVASEVVNRSTQESTNVATAAALNITDSEFDQMNEVNENSKAVIVKIDTNISETADIAEQNQNAKEMPPADANKILRQSQEAIFDALKVAGLSESKIQELRKIYENIPVELRAHLRILASINGQESTPYFVADTFKVEEVVKQKVNEMMEELKKVGVNQEVAELTDYMNRNPEFREAFGKEGTQLLIIGLPDLGDLGRMAWGALAALGGLLIWTFKKPSYTRFLTLAGVGAALYHPAWSLEQIYKVAPYLPNLLISSPFVFYLYNLIKRQRGPTPPGPDGRPPEQFKPVSFKDIAGTLGVDVNGKDQSTITREISQRLKDEVGTHSLDLPSEAAVAINALASLERTTTEFAEKWLRAAVNGMNFTDVVEAVSMLRTLIQKFYVNRKKQILNDLLDENARGLSLNDALIVEITDEIGFLDRRDADLTDQMKHIPEQIGQIKEKFTRKIQDQAAKDVQEEMQRLGYSKKEIAGAVKAVKEIISIIASNPDLANALTNNKLIDQKLAALKPAYTRAKAKENPDENDQSVIKTYEDLQRSKMDLKRFEGVLSRLNSRTSRFVMAGVASAVLGGFGLNYLYGDSQETPSITKPADVAQQKIDKENAEAEAEATNRANEADKQLREKLLKEPDAQQSNVPPVNDEAPKEEDKQENNQPEQAPEVNPTNTDPNPGNRTFVIPHGALNNLQEPTK